MLDLTDALRDVPALDVRWSAGLQSPIAAVAVSPDGSDVAVGLVEGSVFVLSTHDATQCWQNDGHASGTLSLTWSADGLHLASSGLDGDAHVYDAANGQRTATLPGGARWASRVAFEPCGERLVTAAGKRLRLWHRDGALLAEWPERSSTILDIAWRPAEAGRPFFAATSYGAVGFYDPLFPNESSRELSWQGSSLVLAWSPNAKYLATGDQDRSVHFWITKSGRDLQMSGYPRKVRELTWHHSSRYLATGGGHFPCVWDCGGRGPAGTTPLQFEFHEEPVSAIAFQHAGGYLASGALDGSLAVWALGQTDRPIAIRGLGDEIVALSWLPTDDALVVATLGGDVVCLIAPRERDDTRRPPQKPARRAGCRKVRSCFAATAVRVVRNPAAGILLAMSIGVLACWIGIIASYDTGWPVGFFITVATTISYLLAQRVAMPKLSRRTVSDEDGLAFPISRTPDPRR